MSDTAVKSERDLIAQAISSVWWIILLRAVLLIALGCYALFRPGMTLIAFTQVIGIFIIIDGIVAIVAAIMGWRDSALWTIVRGILAILIGALVVGNSVVVAGFTAFVVIFILAIHAIASGILEIVVAIRHRKEIEGEVWLIIGGVLSILFGLMLAAVPLFSAAIFIRILGVYAILFGIALVFLAFQTKGLAKELKSAE